MQDRIVKHGTIVFVGASIVNVLNYLFQLIMARMLSPVEYGILIALFAVFNIFVIAASSINTVVAKFTTIFRTKNELGKIKYLILAYGKILVIFSIAVIVLILLASNQIAFFLNINESALIPILFVAGCLAYFNAVFTGALNGLQRFVSFSIANITGAVGKLGFAVLLVLLGYGVAGAVGALVFGLAAAVLVGFFLLKDVLREKAEKFNVKKAFSYSAWILLAFVCLAVLSNIDVVLVKHFFSGEEAGIYSAAFVLARVIFYATAALAIVLLPKAVNAFSLKQHPEKLLKKTLAIMSFLCVGFTAAYFLLPTLVVDLLVGTNYVLAIPLLGWFAIATSLFSFTNLLAVYYVSIHRKKFALLLLLFSIIEIALISAFHASLMQVIMVMIGVQIALLAFMAGYYFIDLEVSKFEID